VLHLPDMSVFGTRISIMKKLSSLPPVLFFFLVLGFACRAGFAVLLTLTGFATFAAFPSSLTPTGTWVCIANSAFQSRIITKLFAIYAYDLNSSKGDDDYLYTLLVHWQLVKRPVLPQLVFVSGFDILQSFPENDL
jgi:hypothetical protein